MPDDTANPHFTAADVCRAAEITPVLLKSWISRGDDPVIPMRKEDRAAVASGAPHMFTLRRVIQITITAKLAAMGFAPRKASMAALRFTDMDRMCRHFPEGDTFLAIEEDGRVLVLGSALEAGAVVGGTREATILVNVTRLEERVRITLGMDREVNRAPVED